MSRQNTMTLVGALALLLGLGGPALAQAPGPDGRRQGHMLEQMDTNKDGRISREEHAKAAEQRFVRMDANGDGFVTKEEAEQAHKAMREQHRGQAKPKQQ